MIARRSVRLPVGAFRCAVSVSFRIAESAIFRCRFDTVARFAKRLQVRRIVRSAIFARFDVVDVGCGRDRFRAVFPALSAKRFGTQDQFAQPLPFGAVSARFRRKPARIAFAFRLACMLGASTNLDQGRAIRKGARPVRSFWHECSTFYITTRLSPFAPCNGR